MARSGTEYLIAECLVAAESSTMSDRGENLECLRLSVVLGYTVCSRGFPPYMRRRKSADLRLPF